MRIEFTIPAGAGERFAPDAFVSSVDQEIPLRIGEASVPARVVMARVSSGGRSATLTIDVGRTEMNPGMGRLVDAVDYAIKMGALRSVSIAPTAAVREHLHRITCAAKTRGCPNALIWKDHCSFIDDKALPDAGLDLLQLNGWRLDRGQWICPVHSRQAETIAFGYCRKPTRLWEGTDTGAACGMPLDESGRCGWHGSDITGPGIPGRPITERRPTDLCPGCGFTIAAGSGACGECAVEQDAAL